MTLAEKSKKLLEYSVILKAIDKKTWLELLPKMNEMQIQVLYNVLVDEVKAWKKEGITLIPDLAIESQLLPVVLTPEKGASLNALKAMLEQKPAAPVKAEPKDAFAKKLDKDVHTPELNVGKPDPVVENTVEDDFNEPEEKVSIPNTQAWMVSNKVVVPKHDVTVVRPKPLGVPKVRNRVAKHGLQNLQEIKSIDDLSKIEAAHLRQGPLKSQLTTIKQIIAYLAKENDLLPINILPVFEQSPLFQLYLKAGFMLIEKNSGDDKFVFDEIMDELETEGGESMSQEEFEAVADLKKELEVLAGL